MHASDFKNLLKNIKNQNLKKMIFFQNETFSCLTNALDFLILNFFSKIWNNIIIKIAIKINNAPSVLKKLDSIFNIIYCKKNVNNKEVEVIIATLDVSSYLSARFQNTCNKEPNKAANITNTN